MSFKKDFPLLSTITYLDNAAGTLKPKSVVKAMDDFYLKYPMNPHSQDSPLGLKASQAIESTRHKVASLLSCTVEEVIFTNGATDSLNKIALMLEPLIQKGDEIILYYSNHNSNTIPFLELAKRTNAKIVIARDVEKAITKKTKLIALAQMSNGIAVDIDLNRIYKQAQAVNAIVINDAAQAIVHEPVNLTNSDAVIFSSNKLFGPTGVGILAVKNSLLKQLKPATFGGGATSFLNLDMTYGVKDTIQRFEAGTPNTAGIIGLGAGVDYFLKHHHLESDVVALAQYAYDELSQLKDIKIYSRPQDKVIIFEMLNMPSQDIVSALARQNIYLRSGRFCAFLNQESSNGLIRFSLTFYNTKKDIDKLISALQKGGFLDFL